MTDRARQESLQLAVMIGFTRGLRFAAYLCRDSGQRELAIKLSDLARSDLTLKLANMDEVDAQLVFAAAVADCSVPVKRKPTLVLVEGGNVHAR